LFWCYNIISASPINGDGGFSTYPEARYAIHKNHKKVVEYIYDLD
jgi:hypothetical protein